jgi:hypothetical protein
VFPVLFDRLVHGNARIVDGQWLIQGRFMLGCWYRYAGSCLIVLFSIALRGVVFCIGAEYADVVQVLVAVGW